MASATLTKNSGQLRYVALARRLAMEIRKGKYPVDSLLPTEAELTAKYGVAKERYNFGFEPKRERETRAFDWLNVALEVYGVDGCDELAGSAMTIDALAAVDAMLAASYELALDAPALSLLAPVLVKALRDRGGELARLRRQEGVERWAEDGAARLRRV